MSQAVPQKVGLQRRRFAGDQPGGEGKSRSEAGGPCRSDTREMRRGGGRACQSLRRHAALRPGQSVGEPQSKDRPREDFPVRKDGLSFPNQGNSVIAGGSHAQARTQLS